MFLFSHCFSLAAVFKPYRQGVRRGSACIGITARILAAAITVVLFVSYSAKCTAAPAKAIMPAFPSRSVSLADYGGVPDGQTLNTAAFEKALTSLAEQGGGRLVVPQGFWLSGPIRLRSNVDLHLETGALVSFSRNPALYPLKVIDMKGEKSVDSTSPISGEGLENVAITGSGVIDGGGDAWRPVKKSKLTDREWKARIASGGVLASGDGVWWPSRSAMEGAEVVPALRRSGSLKPADYEPCHQYLRPRMLRLINCRKILIEGVTFRNPPAWTLNPQLCEDVSILNVTVLNSPAAQNSDALDLESCRRAVIRGCSFDTGDDGICIKSGKDAAGRRIGTPTEDVLVEGCTVYHAHGGFVIGSEMSGGVRNIVVTNCTFLGSDIGLRFKSARGRGGIVENIELVDLRMENITAAAIDFNMYYGGKDPAEERPDGESAQIVEVNEGTPQFRDIRIQKMICRGAGTAIVLRGLPENPIRNIALDDVSITSRGGVFIKDADGIAFRNVQVENSEGEALRTNHVTNSTLSLLK
jgi:polygalacturonase